MGAFIPALGQIGEAQAYAKIAQRMEEERQRKLAIEEAYNRIQQQYANTNQQRFGLDQQREAQLQKMRQMQIDDMAEQLKQSRMSPLDKIAAIERAVGPMTPEQKMGALGIKLPAPPRPPAPKFSPPKLVKDPQSPTGWSYSIMDELTGKELRTPGAPNPYVGKETPGGAPGVDTRGVEDKAKDVESGLATLKDFSTKERGAIATYMREHKMKPGAGKLNAVQEAGLNVLHVSLFGDPTATNPQEKRGLKDAVGVLDSTKSRKLLIMAGAGQAPPGAGQWAITKLYHSAFYDMMTAPEKEYVYQLNRAVTAINALRTVTGLPRSTQQLMDRYVMELADPATTPSSKDAMTKISLIEREIKAARAGAGTTGSESAAPDSDPLGVFK